MSQKIQFFLIVCITIASAVLLYNMQATHEPILQDITINQPDERVITVYGFGEVKASLDKVEFQVSIDTKYQELADARMEIEERTLKIIDILQSHTIQEKDINIGILLLKVNSTFTSNPKVLTYSGSRTISVTLNELTELTPLFTDMQDAGFNRIEHIRISTSKFDWYLEQALQLALKNAEEIAKSIAFEINREIGPPISIQELTPSYDDGLYFDDLISFFAGSKENYREESAFSISEITIGAHVTVRYELK
jgi:uncharacterized protein YggE